MHKTQREFVKSLTLKFSDVARITMRNQHKFEGASNVLMLCVVPARWRSEISRFFFFVRMWTRGDGTSS